VLYFKWKKLFSTFVPKGTKVEKSFANILGGGSLMDVKKHMREAMYRLLLKDSIEDISVNMILNESGVARTTFYRHYKDKYDLMNSYYETYFIETLSDASDKSWFDVTLTIITFVCTNRQYYSNAFKVEGINSCSDFFYNHSLWFAAKCYMERKPATELTIEEEAAIVFYSAGCLQLIKQWFKKGGVTPPEEVSKIMCSIMPPILSEVLC